MDRINFIYENPNVQPVVEAMIEYLSQSSTFNSLEQMLIDNGYQDINVRDYFSRTTTGYATLNSDGEAEIGVNFSFEFSSEFFVPGVYGPGFNPAFNTNRFIPATEIFAHELVHFALDHVGNEGLFGWNITPLEAEAIDVVNDIRAELGIDVFRVHHGLNGRRDGTEAIEELLNRECFVAGTLIAMWPKEPCEEFTKGANLYATNSPDGVWFKSIEELVLGDRVVSADKDGNLVAGMVTKLFTNTTTEFVRLKFSDNRVDLVTTPGHRFLTETGEYMEIGQMLRFFGGSVRLVDMEGSIVEATAERLVYSTEAAHLFPEAESKTIAMQGNTVLQEQVEFGWQTYNFEVETYHNYVAGGIRVHNDSILGTLVNDDVILSVSDDLSGMVVVQDGGAVVVRLGAPDANGDTQVFAQVGFVDNPFLSLNAQTVVEDLIDASPSLAGDPATLLINLTSSGLLPEPDLAGAFVLGVGLIASFDMDDVIEGTSGDDPLLNGDADNNIISGMAGDDTIDGKAGADTISAGDGDDFITGGSGDDTLSGGSGSDTYYFYNGDGTDTITDFDIESDQIKINGVFVTPLDQPTQFSQSGSNVVVSYNGGADTLAVENVDLSDWENTSATYGTPDDDVLEGESGDNEMFGGDGDDTMSGYGGVDIMYGGNGNDSIYAGPAGDFLYGGQGNDFLAGNTGDDYIEGNRGNDTLRGDNGFDALLGGGGNDYLYGDAQDDILDGGNGIDVMFGGTGSDTFVFTDEDHISTNSAMDSIRDFDSSEGDVINLASIGGLSFSNSGAAGTVGFRLSASGSNAVIGGHTDGDGVIDFSIFMLGVISLTSADFEFANVVTYDEYVLV